MMLWLTPSVTREIWTNRWPIVSWACTSTNGPWITDPAAAKLSDDCSMRDIEQGLSLRLSTSSSFSELSAKAFFSRSLPPSALSCQNLTMKTPTTRIHQPEFEDLSSHETACLPPDPYSRLAPG